MAKTILVAGYYPAAITNTANTTMYWPFLGALTPRSTTESFVQHKMYTAGTCSGLSVVIEANSVNNTTVMTFRKNATDGNQSISVTTTQTGIFIDASGTDTITANDLIDLEITPAVGSTGTIMPGQIKVEFDTDTSTTKSISKVRMGTTSVGSTTASTTWFKQFGANSGGTTTTVETDAQAKMQYAATFRNLAVNLSINSRTTITTFRFRKNAVNGNQSIAVPVSPSGTGRFEDTSATDTVAVNDLVNFSVTNGASAEAITYNYIDVDFETTTNPGVGMCDTVNDSLSFDYGAAATKYVGLGGVQASAVTLTTDTINKTKVNDAYTFKKMSVNVRENGGTATDTITFRKNSVDTAMTVSTSGTATGWLQDLTNTVSTVSGDFVGYKVVTGTTSAINIGHLLVYTEIAGVSTSIDTTVTGKAIETKQIVHG